MLIKNVLLAALLIPMLFSCSSTSKLKKNEVSKESSAKFSFQKPDTLAFEITKGNNIIFKTVLNDTDTLDMFLDTGGTSIVLKHSAIKERTSLLHNGKNKKYKEVNYDPLKGGYSLTLGNMRWEDLTIYPTSLLPEESDGHFGWNLFKGKVVELDYEKKLMIVHSYYDGNLSAYAKLEVEYINTLFCVKGTIKVGETEFTNRYLFDSGFQRAIVMDKDLREKSKFPDNLPVIKESKLKNSAGTEFINRVVEIDEICLSTVCANQVPIQLLSTPNPARFETHILGNELLKRFNTILDFQNSFVYLKPNSLMSLPYVDAS